MSFCIISCVFFAVFYFYCPCRKTDDDDDDDKRPYKILQLSGTDGRTDGRTRCRYADAAACVGVRQGFVWRGSSVDRAVDGSQLGREVRRLYDD